MGSNPIDSNKIFVNYNKDIRYKMKFNHVKMEELEQEEFIDDSFSFAENIRKAFELDKDNDDHKSIKGYHSISQFTGDACLRKIYYRVKNPKFIIIN